MAATTETTDGPVMSFMNKRLRALKKKYNKILQLEESISQGKTLNKDQEEVLRTKPSVLTLIDEYEKLRQPLSAVLQEELSLNPPAHQPKPTPSEAEPPKAPPVAAAEPNRGEESKLEDLLKLLYFGLLFDVKPQSEFTNIMLTRNHERECCLTYDYVTDDATDLLGEKDLDLISLLGGLVVSRPPHSGLSHKNALRSCLQHAKHWLENSDQPIEDGVDITYAALRERLNKILGSDYFTTTPEMKDPGDVAAAAGKYVPVQGSSVSSEVTVHTEGDFAQYEQKDEEAEHSQGQEDGGADPSSPVEEPPKESEIPNSVDGSSLQMEKSETDVDELNSREVETKNQQYIPRKDYQNNRGSRGGGGGRRGYPNIRGARGTRGGYQNGRGQYYDHPGNYFQRNYHNNTRGRAAGGNAYNNHGYARGRGAQADEVHAES